MKIESGNIKIEIENFYNDYWKKDDCILRMYRDESFVGSTRFSRNLNEDEMILWEEV